MSKSTKEKNEVINIENQSRLKQTSSILNSFKQEFSTSVIPIHINSINREVNFREVTVQEQKSLSKTMIQNERRKDIVYDSQCQLINKLCLEEGFDIYKMTEFDRIKILMEIYSENFVNNEIEYTCKECGTKNKYKLDFEKVVSIMNQITLEDKTYKMEDRIRIYNFVLNYPSVRSVSDFYHDYMKKYKGTNHKEQEILDNLGNMEYVNLFIKHIDIIKKADKNDVIQADLDIMTYAEIEQLLSVFPQNIVFDDENGIIRHITKEFIEKLNSAFNYEKCAQCGAEAKGEGVGSVMDFF